ncbi:MFS transporter [Fulvivirga sp. RKSG066]|uniref:MFS transporter n=1 Tax=Fulvivirga aurantia TaxID=2529383 RepID=UPI0012BBFCB9|nr:MFS transporter [Fulvivirga aurantia]MTI20514.1 MFS transporter [Fulvivirga aurantia]
MKHKKAIKAIILFASSMTVMSGAVISPALPSISNFFDRGSDDLLTKLVLTMPAIFIAGLSPVAGYLIDRFGRKTLLAISLIIYGIAGTAGFFIENIYLLLVSRAVLGIGVAGIMSAATTLIGDYFSGEERSKFMGFQASFMALGGVVYLNLGGLLADWSWRGPFLIYATALTILPFALYYIFEPKSSQKAKSNSDGKLLSGKVILIYTIGLLGMLFFYMVPVQLPFLLEQEAGVSSSLVGLAISVSTITGAIVSINYNRIKKLTSFARIYGLSFILFAIGYGIISSSNNYYVIITGLAFSGFGMGLIMPNGNLWLMEITDEKKRGRIIGGMTAAIFAGQFLSPIAVAPLVDTFGVSQSFLVAAGLMLILSITLAIINPYKVKSYALH